MATLLTMLKTMTKLRTMKMAMVTGKTTKMRTTINDDYETTTLTMTSTMMMATTTMTTMTTMMTTTKISTATMDNLALF
jgi:hypothetical protein